MNTQAIQNVANDIAEIIKDYRAVDGFQVPVAQVLRWVNQFEAGDRLFILNEVKRVFQKRYVSEARAHVFLKVVVEKLAADYKYATPQAFLAETTFLDLQEEGKSQKVLLMMLEELVKDQYGISLSNSNMTTSKNFVYLDDIFCTGNTVFYDLKLWVEQIDNGERRLDHLLRNRVNIILGHIFTHNLNIDKLKGRFYHTLPSLKYEIYAGVRVDNDYRNPKAKLDFLFPLREGQSQKVMDYFAALQTDTEGVFRRAGRPADESFFSSAENRVRFENILLNKGLEILSGVSVQKENLRPLGYTLPTHKNLGFGTLCFTWRNVPNNTPLVFWYSTPDWMPLFVNKR